MPELKGKGAGGEGNEVAAPPAAAASTAAAAPDESFGSGEGEAAAASSTKKSSGWGFKMPVFAVPSLPQSLLAPKSDEVKATAVMSDDDAALDKIGQETKDWLAAVVDADKKARALAQVITCVWAPHSFVQNCLWVERGESPSDTVLA